MQDASVIDIFTQIFGYETIMELKQHLKSLAGTGHFWSKLLYPREISSELGEGPDNSGRSDHGLQGGANSREKH
jgi:hypothetical protein